VRRRHRAWGRIVVATVIVALGCGALALGCGDEGATTGAAETQPAVVADTTFLADITRNVAGERLSVDNR